MSASCEYPDSIFPVAFGSELERGIVDNAQGYFDEPYPLAYRLNDFIPHDLDSRAEGYAPNSGRFLKNSGLIYVGGASDGEECYTTNIETATPECASPAELVRYMRAADVLLHGVVTNYAQQTTEEGNELTVRTQHRVVDPLGNRKGCHDSFGLIPAQIDLLQAPDGSLPDKFAWHLATRSFVTGAGLVRSHKLHYAQKVGGLHQVRGYGYFGTMYRTDKTNGTARVEVRCNDTNISDWASWMRVGSTALVLALLQTPLEAELKAPNFYFDETLIDRVKEMNSLRLTDDGEYIRRKHDPVLPAVDYQERIADLSMDKLWLYTDDMPEEYFEIARELARFTQDMRKVIRGDQPISVLADRADWAAKMAGITSAIRRQRSYGERRHLGDTKSIAADLRYDVNILTASHGHIIDKQTGTGFKRRERGKYLRTVAEHEVKAALVKPPASTRAQVRADILHHYPIKSSDWQEVRIDHPDESEKDGYLHIRLPHVFSNKLAEDSQLRLEQVKQIR